MRSKSQQRHFENIKVQQLRSTLFHFELNSHFLEKSVKSQKLQHFSCPSSRNNFKRFYYIKSESQYFFLVWVLEILLYTEYLSVYKNVMLFMFIKSFPLIPFIEYLSADVPMSVARWRSIF